MTNVGGTLFFAANSNTTTNEGKELWKSDGTEAGTVLVKDVLSGVESSDPQQLTNLNGSLLFFSATTPETGRELWKSDGTTTGTVLVKDINADTASGLVSRPTDVNGTLFFR